MSAEQVAQVDDLVGRAIRRYDQALRGFLRWKLNGNDEDVQDAVQETYEHLLRYRDSERDELPRALVMRIAANVVTDRARQQASRRSFYHQPVDDLEIESPEAAPERRVLAQEEVALIRAAIRDMPPRCQEVFLLSRIKAMSYPQIAAQLGISVKAVEKNISRALTLCRKRVGEPRR